MKVQYKIDVLEQLTLESRHKYLFSQRAILRKGSYEVRFDSNQLSYEKDIQDFLKWAGKNATGRLQILELGPDGQVKRYNA